MALQKLLKKRTKLCAICGKEQKTVVINDDGKMQLGFWRTEDDTFECITCAFERENS